MMYGTTVHFTCCFCLFYLPGFCIQEQYSDCANIGSCGTVSLNCNNSVIQGISGRYYNHVFNCRGLSDEDLTTFRSSCSTVSQCSVHLQHCPQFCHCAEVNYNCVEPTSATSTQLTTLPGAITSTVPAQSTTRKITTTTGTTVTIVTTVTTAKPTHHTTTVAVPPLTTITEHNGSTTSPWTTESSTLATAVSATTVSMTTSTTQPTLKEPESPQTEKTSLPVALSVGVAVGVTMLLITITSVSCVLWRRRRNRKGDNSETNAQDPIYENTRDTIQMDRTQGLDINTDNYTALALGQTGKHIYSGIDLND